MKKNLAVIFGGRSSEHEVSCVSVVTIAKAVDLEKYNMFLIGITKDGEWKLVEDIASIEDGSWMILTARVNFKFNKAYGRKGPVLTYIDGTACEKPEQDVATFY